MRISLLLLLCFAAKQSFAQTISGVVNEYRKVLWADSAKGAVKLSNVSGFGSYVGRKVMLVQMKGATIDQTNTSSYGNISSIGSAGYYEVGTICGFLQDTMILERKLNNFYDVTGFVQCIVLPDISGNATVTDTLKAQAWDSIAGTGGIIALDVPGTLTINKPIDASGAGFRGGIYQAFTVSCTFTTGVTAYYYANTATTNSNGGPKGEGIAAFIATKECGRGKQANGGGGGNNHNSGGGGGSNYGTGGQGGTRTGTCASNTPGLGGLTLNGYGYATTPTTQNRLFLGGGGGSGQDNNTTGTPGGHGGGIVYITANRIEGGSATASDNKIMANGTKPYRYITIWGIASNDAGSDGGGGGGAGGAIVLNVGSYAGNSIVAEAKGGNGSGTETFGQNQCSGPGGGGGGGVVWLKQASLPAGISASVAGGTNGTTSATASCANSANSATSGAVGITLLNFALASPRDTASLCRQLVPLYVHADISGYGQGGRRFITATVSHRDYINTCTLQKAAAQNTFADITTVNGTGQPQYQFTDAQDMDKLAIYRIKLITKDGLARYSPVLRMGTISNNKNLSADVYPNPSKQKISVQIYTATAGPAVIAIANTLGHRLVQGRQWLQKGYNIVPLNIHQLPDGPLLLTIHTATDKATRSFIKLGN
jgi:hypothetical protein